MADAVDSIEYELPSSIRRQSEGYHVNVTTRERTPDMAVQNFDGTFDTVRAREVRTRFCNRALFNFVMTATVVLIALLTSLILLAVRGFDAPGATWLMTTASFCLGVFLPAPQIEKT